MSPRECAGFNWADLLILAFIDLSIGNVTLIDQLAKALCRLEVDFVVVGPQCPSSLQAWSFLRNGDCRVTLTAARRSDDVEE